MVAVASQEQSALEVLEVPAVGVPQREGAYDDDVARAQVGRS